MIPVSAIILGSFSSFRVTKLLINDEILREPREKVHDFLLIRQKYPLADKTYYLITCPWCLGAYVSLAHALLYYKNPSLFEKITLPTTFSAVTGLLSSKM